MEVHDTFYSPYFCLCLEFSVKIVRERALKGWGDEGERDGGRRKEKWIQPQDPLHSTEDETEGLCGAPGNGSLSVPHFLFVGNRLQPPWPFLSSKGQIQTVGNQGAEGTQRQGRRSQETMVLPWSRVLVPPQGVHITVILNSSTKLKSLTKGRC